MSSLDSHYSATGIEARILAGIRAAGLNPEQGLSPEELGALDYFQTGGRYAFQEKAAGKTASSCFPLPWASDPADNFLVSAEAMRSLLDGCGFVTDLFEDTSEIHLSRTIVTATPAVPGQLGLGVFVDNLAQKATNARRSLEECRVRLIRGVFRVN